MESWLQGRPLPQPRFRIAPLPEDLRRVQGFRDLQTFFPTLSKIYRLSKHQSGDVWLDSKWRITSLDISGTSGPCQLGLAPNVDCSGSIATAGETIQPRRAFLKVTHLLDPVRWMKGHYSLPKHSGLPWHSRTWTNAWNKLQDPWNQAYVETLAAYALGRLRDAGVSPHFNEFYGAFCARAETYRYNITDDFDTFRNARWFWHGRSKGMYRLCITEARNPGKEVINELTEELLAEPSELGSQSGSESDAHSEVSAETEEIVVDEGGEMRMDHEDSVSIRSDDAMSELETESEGESEGETSPTQNSATSASEDEVSEGSEESELSAGDEYRVYAEINNFPVMLIALEENQGTMDELLDSAAAAGAEPGTPEWELRWSAWLFQVLAALSVAQDVIGFTHNDLHTNNIVWTETSEEFLYYRNNAGATFKVPTFGKLFRVIDFGRAIFRLNGQFFISDDFRAGNDADGQFCFKPLHPRPPPGEEVRPNPSFDLCRLAVSLFDSLFPDAPEDREGGAVLSSEEEGGHELTVRETVSDLYNLLWTWMLDDEGRNVLIEPDGEERFPDFDLYKHIAAKCHRAVPALQFSKPSFDRFQATADAVPAGARIWSLFC